MVKLVYEKLIDSKICPKIFNYAHVDSTIILARKYIEEKNYSGFAIIADIQHAGKGQKDKFWESPHGGLWTTIVIKPIIELQLIGLIPLLSAISVTNALRNFNVETTLKWPNDILTDSFKKIGGIIVESKVTQFTLNHLIIGIGLNVNNTINQYSKPLQKRISTIFEEFKIKIDLEKLLIQIIQQIEYWIEKLKSHGAQIIIDTWKNTNNILGMKVIAQCPNGDFEGKAVDISPQGYLILEMSDTETVNISSGTITLLTSD